MKLTKADLVSDSAFTTSFNPLFFRLGKDDDKKHLEKLLSSDRSVIVYDTIKEQLRELIKSLHPSLKLKDDDYTELTRLHLNGADLDEYGIWVYYPWTKRLVHILDEEEFIELRTNRNRYKITKEEQEQLRQKKIGVVGLSVGQSIALTLAMERTCGEIRLADFDTAELTNLNRIRTGLHNLGLSKAVIAAREIAEIDPFIKLKVFKEGLTNENIDAFFSSDEKLDLLIEVCDGLDMKIVSRFKARQLGIPVVMETNDRGMVDVERFDLEPDRSILHGLAEGLDPQNISDLSNEEKIPYILRMVGAENISTRLKASMIEVEQSINTWPQTASSVVLGGAVATDVSRRLLLGQLTDSGRYYIDLDVLIGNARKEDRKTTPPEYFAPDKLSDSDFLAIAGSACPLPDLSIGLSEQQLLSVINSGTLAPSGGNSQPWKFVYLKNHLFVFHDLHASYSFLDFQSLGSYVALGAVLENIKIKCDELGLTPLINYSDISPLVAIIGFQHSENQLFRQDLYKGTEIRITNRIIAERQPLPSSHYVHLQGAIKEYGGATLDIVHDEHQMRELGEILAATEKMVLMHPRGHFDAFKKELRWSDEENAKSRDGIDVTTLGISKGEISALRIANDPAAIQFVREVIQGGNAFKKMANKAVAASSALGIISMPEYSRHHFLLGGQAVERVWIEANLLDISVQPITQFTFMLARLIHGNGAELDAAYQNELKRLQSQFFHILPHLENRQPVFIFRLCRVDAPPVKALRKPIESVLIRQRSTEKEVF